MTQYGPAEWWYADGELAANQRAAVFGPGNDKAIGLKKTPGPLFGLTGDEWAALGVAVTYSDGGIRGQDPT